ncbi:MAG: hypothetical protein VW405_04265 [Rhodospirillaceae bacterium]
MLTHLNWSKPLILACGLALTGCAQTATITSTGGGATPVESTTPSAFAQFPDIPVPPGSKIVVDKTLVFGSKPWFGQLTLDSSTSANRAFDYYRANLTNLGWEEVTSVRAPTSILTYADADRVLAIAIRAGTITGSEITVTVSPRGRPQPQAAPIQGSPIQGDALPPPVTRQ